MSSTHRTRAQSAPLVGAVVLGSLLVGTIWLVNQQIPGNSSDTASAMSDGYPGTQEAVEDVYFPEPVQPTDAPAEVICNNLNPTRLELEEGSEQRAWFDQQYELCVEARQHMPTPGPTPSVTNTPWPTVEVPNYAKRQLGDGQLGESGASPLPRNYVGVNYWWVHTDDRNISVFAGTLRADPDNPDSEQDGVVIVMAYDSVRRAVEEESGAYQLPEAHSLRIVDAQGAILTLVSDNGLVATFDVYGRTLALAADQTVPRRESGGGFVVETGQTPYEIPGYVFTNQWYRDVDGQRITVLGGTDNETGEQSIVAIVTSSVDDPDNALTVEVYAASVPGGRLLVMDAEGDEVRLAQPAGNLVLFDLNSHEFNQFLNG